MEPMASPPVGIRRVIFPAQVSTTAIAVLDGVNAGMSSTYSVRPSGVLFTFHGWLKPFRLPTIRSVVRSTTEISPSPTFAK
jgi:hypothetical protein